jgi:modulator of FtsH protease
VIPEGWADFAVAAAGATAALAGLLIVAISVNVTEIIASRAPIAGARSTITSLVLAIAVSLFILPPGQTLVVLGVITLVLTAVAVTVQLMSIIAQWSLTREGVTTSVRATIVGLAVAEHVPFLVGAVLLLFGQQTGLWGLVVGVVMVVIASMVNAWVLLIEVRR